MAATWEPKTIDSQVMAIRDDWIDYNGHLNMAYYNVLFDTACDHVFEMVGLGPDYVKSRNASFFTAEVHVCYVRELSAGMPVIVSFQLIDLDEKRAHFYQELRHADEGWLSATSEQMSLHVDMAARKVAPWPAEVLTSLKAMFAAHTTLPRPDRAGRHIEIRKK